MLGAGPAGLVAAMELEKRDFDVQVFEARDRVGGRIHTIRRPFSEGVITEAGALYLADTNPAIDYARALGLELEIPAFHSDLKTLQFIDGKRLLFGRGSSDRWPYELPAEDRALPIRSLRGKYVWRHIHQLEGFDRLLSADFPQSRAAELDQMTVREFLDAQGVSPVVQRLVNYGYLEAYNGGIDHFSVLALARERASFGQVSTPYQIRGGNDRLCWAMAASLQQQVRLESPVIGIEQPERGVRFVVEQNHARSVHDADYAVVTAPLSVLAATDLKFAFTGLRRRAMEEMPSVSATRTFIETRRPFWLDDKLAGGTTDTKLGLIFVHHDAGRQGSKGVFESFAYGEDADRLAGLTPEERHRQVSEIGETLYPGLAEHAERVTSVCWGADPWARGNFVSSLPGQIVEFHGALNEPEGRIYLAGDSIGDCPGYSHSAFQSGIAVAEKIASRTKIS